MRETKGHGTGVCIINMVVVLVDAEGVEEAEEEGAEEGDLGCNSRHQGQTLTVPPWDLTAATLVLVLKRRFRRTCGRSVTPQNRMEPNRWLKLNQKSLVQFNFKPKFN